MVGPHAPGGGKHMLREAQVVVTEVIGSFMDLWRHVTKPNPDDDSDISEYNPLETVEDIDEFEIVDTPVDMWDASCAQGCYLRNLDVLPKVGSLLDRGYYISPSLAQLDALHTEDPESLHRVENFKLGHPKYGYIHWLEPVDLWDLDLENVVKLKQGEVQLYDDKTIPPIGSGLNRRSLVYLFNMHAYHPRTHHLVRDGEELVVFTNRLVRECHKNGVLYKNYLPDKGIWIFEAPPKRPPSRTPSPSKLLKLSSASGSSEDSRAATAVAHLDCALL